MADDFRIRGVDVIGLGSRARIFRNVRTFEAALADLENNKYSRRSLYFAQLSQYLPYFPKAQILMLTAEDMQKAPQQTMQTVFRFLEVSDTFSSPKFYHMQHRSVYKRRKNGVGKWLQASRVGKFVDALPPELRWHTKKLVYCPFSHEIERPTLPAQLRARLADYLRDDIRLLREFIRQDFADWSV